MNRQSLSFIHWLSCLLLALSVGMCISKSIDSNLQSINASSDYMQNNITQLFRSYSLEYNNVMVEALSGRRLKSIRNASYVHPGRLTEIKNERYISRFSSGKERVAVVVVYTGKSWPMWIHAFLYTSQFAASLYDWIFIVPIEYPPPLIEMPSNARVFQISMLELAHRIVTIDTKYPRVPTTNSKKEFQQRAIKILYKVLVAQPYVIVEFKPCFGYLFKDILTEYSHWAYGDIDMLIGKMDKLLPVNALSKYDIISVSFGDPYILYLRGQMTIHKNNEFVNNLWTQCSFLNSVIDRIMAYDKSIDAKWQFQSAEGCYSYAVMMQSNASVIILTNQLSDAFNARLELRESYMLGKSVVQCHQQPAIGENDRIRSFVLQDNYIGNETSTSFYYNRVYKPIKLRNYKCVYRYWFNKKFEMCLDFLPMRADVVVVNGSMGHALDPRRDVLNTCKEGSMYHFVFWKKHYYSHTVRIPSPDTNLLLVSDSGFIPYKLQSYIQDIDYSRLLMKIPGAIENFGTLTPSIEGNKNFTTSYCIRFSADLKQCFCPLSFNNITKHTKQHQNLTGDITLITIGSSNDFVKGNLNSIMKDWIGPKIIVIAKTKSSSVKSLSTAITSALNQFDFLTIVEVYIGCSLSKPSLLPDNTLYNIGLDLTLTPMVAIIPPGFRLKTFSDQNISVSEEISRQIRNSYKSRMAIVFASFQRVTQLGKDDFLPFAYQNISLTKHQVITLKIPFSDAMIDARKTVPHLSKEDILKGSSIMLPIAFSRTATMHGTNFIRFPEELNGLGCHGTAIFRIVFGAGLRLYWGNKIYASYEALTVDNSDLDIECYGCLSAKDNNGTAMFTKKLNSYYTRTENLRRYDLRGLYTRRPYAFLFDKHQKDRLGRGK